MSQVKVRRGAVTFSRASLSSPQECIWWDLRIKGPHRRSLMPWKEVFMGVPMQGGEGMFMGHVRRDCFLERAGVTENWTSQHWVHQNEMPTSRWRWMTASKNDTIHHRNPRRLRAMKHTWLLLLVFKPGLHSTLFEMLWLFVWSKVSWNLLVSCLLI